MSRARAALRTSALVLSLSGSLALTACTTLRGVSPLEREAPASWEARRSTLQAWSSYGLRGRVAVARGDEGFSGALRWVQSGVRVRLEIDGPLGVGGARYDLDPATVDGQRLQLALGIPVPVTSLRYWLLGVPDPTTAAEESLDSGGVRLTALRQEGWTVAYPRYAAVPGTGLDLPQRIEVSREGLRLRLLIEAWEGLRP